METRDLDRAAIVAGLLFIVLGVLFLLERAGVLEVRAAYVWPLVLISLGVAVLLGGGRRRGYRERFNSRRRAIEFPEQTESAREEPKDENTRDPSRGDSASQQ